MRPLTKLFNSMTGKAFTVAVEGNIGSGKSTFLEHFNKSGNVRILPEPVESWRNCNGHNLLGLMYDHPQKWSFNFQSYVQLTMLQNHIKRVKEPVKIMERSLYSARYCFVEKLQRDKLLNDASVAVNNAWFEWIVSNFDVNVDLIVYIRTSPEVVYERMLQRGRPEEKLVPLRYLKDLHEIHEEWLIEKKIHTLPAPVVVLNGDLDLCKVTNEYNKCESQILNKQILANG